MNKKFYMPIGLSTLILLLAVTETFAELITVQVEGVVNSVSLEGGFELDGSVVSGTPMTGFCTFDSDVYTAYVSSYGYPFTEISLNVGNYTFTHDPKSLEKAELSQSLIDYIFGANATNPSFNGTFYIDGLAKTDQ